MRWRQVGPFRGGRALAIEGVVGEPDTYYFGAVAGGVWKTIDGGGNWTPLFDKAPISSVGALAVAPSDHNVVYVGTGEAAIRGFMQLIFAQDKPILENQLPKRLPLDPRAETPIRADAVSVHYRRWLRDHAVSYGAIPARL